MVKSERINDVEYQKMSKHNAWVSLLRIALSIVVIQAHFPADQGSIIVKAVSFGRYIAVQCFMFISFYYMAKDFENVNYERIKTRISRLYIPVVFWNIVYFIVVNLMKLLFQNGNELITLKDLMMGLIFSHANSLPVQLWYMITQILIIVIIVVLFMYCDTKKKKTGLLIGTIVVSFVLQYTGVSYYLFATAPYESRYTLGRVIESIPFAACGILYTWHMDKLESVKKVILIPVLGISGIAAKFILPEIETFQNGGLFPFLIGMAICVFTLVIPDVINGKVRYAINVVGSCTMGIYCMHYLIGGILNQIVGYSALRGTFAFDILIFIVCLILTLVARKLIDIGGNKIKWMKQVF